MPERVSGRKRIREMGADEVYDFAQTLLKRLFEGKISNEDVQLLTEAREQFRQLTGRIL